MPRDVAAKDTSTAEKGAKAKGGAPAAKRAGISKTDAPTADPSAPVGPQLPIKYRRLAAAKNNEDKCPVRQRHDGPTRHSSELEGTLATICNCYKANFEVAEGAVENVPTSATFNLTTASGVVVGSVAGIPH